MTLFNFGRKQRLHTQLYGNIDGDEIFKIEDYKYKQGISILLFLYIGTILTIFYFLIQKIPQKILYFLIITLIISGIWLYFNLKEQFRIKKYLYKTF